MNLGFYFLDDPSLLKTLGVSRLDCTKSQQRERAAKKLRAIGIPVHLKGNTPIVKKADLESWLEDDMEPMSIGKIHVESQTAKTFLD